MAREHANLYVPRIVLSAGAEMNDSQDERREYNLFSVSADDPCALRFSRHPTARMTPPPSGKSIVNVYCLYSISNDSLRGDSCSGGPDSGPPFPQAPSAPRPIPFHLRPLAFSTSTPRPSTLRRRPLVPPTGT